MKSYIQAISYHLPEKVITNNDLLQKFPDLKIDDLTRLTGVKKRHQASDDETAADLAFHAARKLFKEHNINAGTIDHIIFCAQGADYITPSTSCLLQDRLGLPENAGSLDINQGCTGFVYGLSVANGLIATGNARNVLLLTSVNISELLHPRDKSNMAIFGDGAAATLISSNENAPGSGIGDFVFGTDGRGYEAIIIKYGGARYPFDRFEPKDYTDASGNLRNDKNFYMNGAAVFTFSIEKAPLLIRQLKEKAGLSDDDVDLYVLHQANRIILESIFRKMKIPAEKTLFHLEDCGNTVSSTIPIALYHAIADGRIKLGDRLILAGFGVGFSWAGCTLRI
ncbi:MAG: ketoacyl-ACP synthase III [Bacteroidales bacterium]|nr:ketoacyl-ACP synthase III [Bacteroidales bacterium]